MNAYRLIEHTADAGIQVTASSAEALFTEAGLALCDLLASAAGPCDGLVCEVQLDGEDWTDLMVNWLRELLYLFNAQERLVREIRITDLTPRQIAARLTGDRVDPQRHTLGHEIKAVTYHQARVASESDRWEARIIFDL